VNKGSLAPRQQPGLLSAEALASLRTHHTVSVIPGRGRSPRARNP